MMAQRDANSNFTYKINTENSQKTNYESEKNWHWETYNDD